jgi:hypothetical protein
VKLAVSGLGKQFEEDRDAKNISSTTRKPAVKKAGGGVSGGL